MPFFVNYSSALTGRFRLRKELFGANWEETGEKKKEEELNPAILYWLQVILIQYWWIALNAWRQMVSVARKQRNLNPSCTHWKLALSSIKYISVLL